MEGDFPLLLTIRSGFPPLRFVNHAERVVYNDNVYEPFPFDVVMPKDDEDDRLELRVDWACIPPVPWPSPLLADITVVNVLGGDPDHAVAGPYTFEVHVEHGRIMLWPREELMI